MTIDKTTILAIIILMVALVFVGFISYENTIQFIHHDAVEDRINLIIQRLEHLIADVTDAHLPTMMKADDDSRLVVSR